MPTQMIRQTTFITGEVDQVVWKRTEDESYLSAAQSLLNCEVATTGLFRKRKTTQFTLDATAYALSSSRMFEFVDKFQRYYLVIMAENTANIFTSGVGTNQVITGRGTNVITGRGTNVVAGATNFNYLQSVITPYTSLDLQYLDYTEDNDSLVFAHPSYAPGRIYISTYTPLVFNFEYLDIYPVPSYDFQTINYNAMTVSYSISGNTLTFNITNNTPNPTGFTTTWIGGSIVGGGASDVEPVGYAIITNVTNTGNRTTFTATIQLPFIASGFATLGSQYSIRQPIWTATLGFPAKVLYYQNRLWFARTEALPETVVGSKINSPINFDVGTGKDTDAIVYTLGISNSGAINWLNGGKQLEIFCENMEFACPQDQNSALTPSNFDIKQQSSYGSWANLKPVTYINDSYIAARTGKAFINYHFNGIGLTYNSTNISVASSHLVKQPRNRALQRGTDSSQDNFIYFLNPSDSSITAFQFAFEYKLAALTPITFEQGVQLIDIATIDNTVYILKLYPLTSRIIVEQFNESFPDTFVKFDSAQAFSMASDGTVTGLDRLDGYTVQVLYQNQNFGEYLVDAGQIVVENPDAIADTVIIGINFVLEFRSMYVFADPIAAPFYKQITNIYVDYYNSLDFTINGTVIPYQTFAQIQAGQSITPQTDTVILDDVNGYNRYEVITINQTSPYDVQILGLGYQISYAVI